MKHDFEENLVDFTFQDYRKLNACTHKDHFPMPFITMLLEEVGVHSRYTFMHGYARYNHIAIAVGDVHKKALTTPWGLLYGW